MRIIKAEKVKSAVARLCIEANYFLGDDICAALSESAKAEASPLGRDVLSQLIENKDISREGVFPLCQDTGMAVVFVKIGQDVRIKGGFLGDAIVEGVRDGYKEGYLRNSVVSDPIIRKNTGDNTPPVIHYFLVPGDKLEIFVSPKGFGSENKSALKMLKPSDGEEGVRQFIIDTVREAGGSPCPPIIVGVGIGGTMEKAALLSKQALLRPVDIRNQDPFYAEMEARLLADINSLGIGPGGFGGSTSALSVNIETFPTHIAGLPVSVNIGCHATRHSRVVL